MPLCQIVVSTLSSPPRSPVARLEETEMYKLELESSYYFPGLMQGHVLELVGRVGVVDSFGGKSRALLRPIFLGGNRTMRGYDHRDIGPRLKKWKLSKGMHEGAQHYGYHVDVMKDGRLSRRTNSSRSNTPLPTTRLRIIKARIKPTSPLEDGTSWNPVMVDGSEPLAAAATGLAPQNTQSRLSSGCALPFYDIGMSYLDPYEFEFGDYADNWGVGLRLTVPMLGPLRLDYGFPISHPDYVDGGGVSLWGGIQPYFLKLLKMKKITTMIHSRLAKLATCAWRRYRGSPRAGSTQDRHNHIEKVRASYWKTQMSREASRQSERPISRKSSRT